MNLRSVLYKEGLSAFSVSASLLIHFAVGVLAVIFMSFLNRPSSGEYNYIQLSTSEFEFPDKISEPEKSKMSSGNIITEKDESNIPDGMEIPDVNHFSADTSVLMQVYKESSLNVRIKYPPGWTYIDQNVKNKLDGITFWFSAEKYNPPPYVHLEVKEKYLFNPKRYRYKFKLNDAVAYFNDPEELAGQYSQTIYMRTETDEDFSIKLIMKGKESFYSFQPLFFAMVKTFKFGKNFF